MGKDESFGALARRWVKKSVEELTTSDRHERADASVEVNRTEHDLREKAGEEAVYTAIPGLRDLRDRQEAARAAEVAQRAADEAAEIAARPLAGVGLTFTGQVDASWSGQLPANVERVASTTPDPEELEWNPFAGEATLRVELTAPIGAQPVIGGLAFARWGFAIPGYAGPGTYDLQAIGQQRAEAGSELDAFDYALSLGTDDDPFYWYAEVPGSVEVADDEKALVVRMTMVSSWGELRVVASVNLPL